VQAGVPLIPIIILGTPMTELVNAILKIVVLLKSLLTVRATELIRLGEGAACAEGP
jgi:hypothetical protein